MVTNRLSLSNCPRYRELILNDKKGNVLRKYNEQASILFPTVLRPLFSETTIRSQKHSCGIERNADFQKRDPRWRATSEGVVLISCRGEKPKDSGACHEEHYRVTGTTRRKQRREGEDEARRRGSALGGGEGHTRPPKNFRVLSSPGRSFSNLRAVALNFEQIFVQRVRLTGVYV